MQSRFQVANMDHHKQCANISFCRQTEKPTIGTIYIVSIVSFQINQMFQINGKQMMFQSNELHHESLKDDLCS